MDSYAFKEMSSSHNTRMCVISGFRREVEIGLRFSGLLRSM